MRGAFFLLISLLLIFCSSMNETGGSISYQIIDTEVYLQKANPYFEITVELNNSSNRSFILYGFKRMTDAILSDSLLCVERPGAGNSIFITDSLGNIMPEEFTIEMHGDDYLQKPVTEDSLFSMFKKLRSEYIDGKEVLKSGQKKQVKLRVNIKSSPPMQQLKPSEYLMYLIYYAGDDLTQTTEDSPIKISLVDEIAIKNDEKKYKASVFSGWVRSNKVKLIVE